ncbi:MAG: SUMF1/EgtB/PvdO family nonheme iron enzyme [Deltaproteobacteria bacterium]|nr:SUMF1/EgtB/PvdO family nonheme iron enzyme [Deltaproteobacteria bacterium]
MSSRREFLLRTLLATLLATAFFCAAAFVTIRMALARDGEPGGAARSSVTITGTFTLPPGAAAPTTLQFVFRRRVPEGGVAFVDACTVPVGYTSINHRRDTTNTFSAEVGLDGCPGLFDGGDVRVLVRLDGAEPPLVPETNINPVPYAHYASQYGTPDCPVGYVQATGRGFREDIRLCVQMAPDDTFYDEIVRVGTGPTAFWIDRYEASVWQNADGTGVRYGTDRNDYPGSFPGNGQWTAPLYARSQARIRDPRPPSAYLTWFQANDACRLSGKRLPTGDEWLSAARGTPDPETAALGDGREGRCLTNVTGPSRTGGRGREPGRIGCESHWGAQDMIGNLQEWTTEWYAGAHTDNTRGGLHSASTTPGWPAGYNGDGTWQVGGVIHAFPSSPLNAAIPSAVLRGGGFGSSERAGIFAVSIEAAPSNLSPAIGFRCVIPR